MRSFDHVLFGAAYYHEYMPYERLERDMHMMNASGINVIRVGESTWSSWEPQPGVFDFSALDRVIEAAGNHGIDVVVGTPTYAIPTWMVALYPDILAETHSGQGRYGARQIMNIAHAGYRFYCERIITEMVAHVADYPQVIGFQIDNETKYFDVVSPDVQKRFVKHLRSLFDDDLTALNAAYGLTYWSNRIDSWEDFPDVSRTINGSLGAEFDRFRREIVTEFLAWQADLVHVLARADQFVTHNFDFAWRGWSYGVQPQTDHFAAAQALDIAGVDIYHPTESQLTGTEIAFGGDMTRSLKGGQNYLLLETQAQGHTGWLPYPGQLRLQAYSHLANGSNSVMYWHWHSLHNSFETYWKGVLSHDLQPNATYREVQEIGRELASIGSHLVNLRKRNRVALMVSNEALTALRWFTIESGFPDPALHQDADSGTLSYNDVVRWLYDALFQLNVECDFLPPNAPAETLSRYSVILTPALYCLPESELSLLRSFVANGGHLISTFRSFVANEHLAVWADTAPHQLTDVFGIEYDQFTRPNHLFLTFPRPRTEPGLPTTVGTPSGTVSSFVSSFPRAEATGIIELLRPAPRTDVLARYDHWAWGEYAAVTRNAFGRGSAEWIGTMVGPEALRAILRDALEHAGIVPPYADLPRSVRVRTGSTKHGTLTYFFNYSDDDVSFSSPISGRILLGEAAPSTINPSTMPSTAAPSATASCAHPAFVGSPAIIPLNHGDTVTISRWNLLIVESQTRTTVQDHGGAATEPPM